MGYTTEFFGSLTLSKKLDAYAFNFINALAKTRRMKRCPEIFKAEHPNDWQDYCYHGEPGIEGEFILPFRLTEELVNGETWNLMADVRKCHFGQSNTDDVQNYNCPPAPQPGLWLQWIIEDCGDHQELVWDEGEKFYSYIEWLEYLIEKFFEPLGIKLNGKIMFQGEDITDGGIICVDDNSVDVIMREQI